MSQPKIISLEDALNQIEEIDIALEKLLETENYSSVIELLSTRLLLISQINEARNNQGLRAEIKTRLNLILAKGNKIQEKISLKKNQISERLKRGRQLKAQNKKINY